jgi:hypothetical protein
LSSAPLASGHAAKTPKSIRRFCGGRTATTAAGAVIGSAIPVIGTVPNGEERLIPTWLAEYIDYAHSMCLSVDTLLWVYGQSSSQPCISRLPRQACA